MDFQPLPEDSRIRVSHDGDAALLDWPAGGGLRPWLAALFIHALLLSAVLTGYFDSPPMRWGLAAFRLLTFGFLLRNLIQDRIALSLPGFRALLLHLLDLLLVVGSVFVTGWAGRGLLVAGISIPLLNSWLRPRPRQPVGRSRLRMKPDTLTWTPGDGAAPQQHERGKVLGTRMLGSNLFVQIDGGSGKKAPFPVPGMLSSSDAAWLQQALEGWRAEGRTLSVFDGLPPVPDGARLTVEEAGGVLQICWGVLAGDFRRKCRVLVYAILLGCSCFMFVPSWSRWPPSMQNLAAAGIQLVVAWSVWRIFWKETYRLARATGHAELRLEPGGLVYDPGAGQGLQTVWRAELDGIATEETKVLVSAESRKKPLALRLPGPTEAAWAAEVIRHWMKTPTP